MIAAWIVRRIIRRTLPHLLALLVIFTGLALTAWYAVGAVFLALVSWPGLAVLLALTAALAGFATNRQETHA